MEISDSEWQEHLRTMDSNRRVIESWPATPPNPSALRCEFSRHRTLAHLRAAQQTWLEAVLLFAEKEKTSIVRPHPWRLFTDLHYELIPWDEHQAAFLKDRDAWENLLNRPNLDRDRGGRLSRKDQTIATLTRHLVVHETHHFQTQRFPASDG